MASAMESGDPYPKSVWAYDAFLARHLDPDGEASYGCPSCGWIPEIIDCHAEFVVRFGRAPCPYVQYRYGIDYDSEVGDYTFRRRDFLWAVPRLLAWLRRARTRLLAHHAAAVQRRWLAAAYAAPRGCMFVKSMATVGDMVGA